MYENEKTQVQNGLDAIKAIIKATGAQRNNVIDPDYWGDYIAALQNAVSTGEDVIHAYKVEAYLKAK